MSTNGSKKRNLSEIENSMAAKEMANMLLNAQINGGAGDQEGMLNLITQSNKVTQGSNYCGQQDP